MKILNRILFAVFVALASFLAVPSLVPLARAEGTACESRGFDLATCDQMFLEDLDRRGLPYNHSDPSVPIRIGHRIADDLTQDPTMHGITVLANKILRDTAKGGSPYDVHMAVSYIKTSVHYYGPPGLEETLNAL